VRTVFLGVSVIGAAFAASVSLSRLSGLHWRHIGPAMFSSRVDDVARVPGNPDILYSAHSTGGLWKSSHGGVTHESVFKDGGTLSVGAVAISPDNPEIVYIGTGEGFPRNSISYGHGIYKTTDGGKTWSNAGIQDSQRFSRIVVDPKTPSIIYAAAMGHAFGPNQERGLCRSNDGGATWKRALFVDERTAASDVAVDPQNPKNCVCGHVRIHSPALDFLQRRPGKLAVPLGGRRRDRIAQDIGAGELTMASSSGRSGSWRIPTWDTSPSC